MHRFFIDPSAIKGKEVVLEDEKLLHQFLHVLRMKVGEQIVVIGSEGAENLAVIKSLSKRRADIEILEKLPFKSGLELENDIFVYQAIPKNLAKLELVLQKCTELGVRGFFPIITKRTELKTLRNVPRLEAIIKESAEQCGAVKLPSLGKILNMDDILENVPGGFNLLAYEKETETTLARVMPDIKKSKTINIFIGPEGGWDEKEIEQMKKAGFNSVGLGARILRTETAPIAIVSAICLS